jgi:hypothetical protein
MPTEAGWYTIVYTAVDTLGNEGVSVRNVYVAEDLGDIEVTLPDTLISETTLGSWVTLDAPTYEGVCGETGLQIKKTVTLGGETYEVTDGFRPETKGEWKITYTLTDYLGRVGTAEHTLNAVIGEGYVLLDELVLPQVFVSDSKYVLPEIYATDYSTGKAERKLANVVVTDKNGQNTYKAGQTFIPSVATNGDKVTLSYEYNGQVLVVREIPAVLVKGNGNKIIGQNYFYGEGITVIDKDDKGTADTDDDTVFTSGFGIVANEAAASCGWTFATPQLTDNLSVVFAGIVGKTNFTGLKITLTDKQNANEQICVTLQVKGNSTSVIVGDTVVDIAFSLNSGDDYTVGYTNGKFSFNGVSVAVNSTTSGEAFEGFSSSLAYIHVDMLNAKAGASYLVRAPLSTFTSRSRYTRILLCPRAKRRTSCAHARIKSCKR